MKGNRTIKAPTGTSLSAKSWLTEAPLRMIMNNLDPDVAERPEDLNAARVRQVARSAAREVNGLEVLRPGEDSVGGRGGGGGGGGGEALK